MPEVHHARLARWAAECAERAVRVFEESRPGDPRPRAALQAARDWADGALPVSDARQHAFAAHAAARETTGAATLAARASGHAAATAHVATHATHAAQYALKSIAEAAGPEAVEAERAWQEERRPVWLAESDPLEPVG